MTITPARAGNAVGVSDSEFEQILSAPCGSIRITAAEDNIEVRVFNNSQHTHGPNDFVALNTTGIVSEQFYGPNDNRIREVWVKGGTASAKVSWSVVLP